MLNNNYAKRFITKKTISIAIILVIALVVATLGVRYIPLAKRMIGSILSDGDSKVIISMDMANKVEDLTKGLDTPQEKCIAINDWIVKNFSTRSDNNLKNEPGMNNVYTWYATREGMCDSRAAVMVEMLHLLNLKSETLHLYDFPDVRQGHVGVQVWYEDDWHFYDPMCAVYFIKDSVVLSFDGILQYADDIDTYRVYTKPGLDLGGSDKAYRDRLNDCYSSEVLNRYKAMPDKSYATRDINDFATVYPAINLSGELPAVFGAVNKSSDDIFTQALDNGISQFILYSLGNGYRIKNNWQFTGAEIGKEYYIRYKIAEVHTAGDKFYAVPTDAEIIRGADFTLNKSSSEWEIVFRPAKEDFSILIDFTPEALGNGASLDMIEIGEK